MSRRRTILPAVLGLLLVAAVPAVADGNGSTEQRQEERSCSAPADPHYSAPGPEDCQDGATTYTATYWSNDVTCGDKNAVTPANPTGVTVYGSGDPAAQRGSVGVCADGSGAAPNPVQGRASFGGSPATGGTLVVDGDKDNANETAQGWIAVTAGPGGAPTYRCGDEYAQGGKADSDTPEDRDTSAECGG